MKFDGFIGQDYPAGSLAISAQRSMNLYLEAEESHDETKAARALLGTPGLALFDTLPTAPVRGIWTGLIDALPGATGTDLCFAVAGSKLYQVFANGTHTLLGDVGDDATHSLVTFQVNGSQVLITSAGLAWVLAGASLTQAFFNNGYGTLSTSGTAATWVSGTQFDPTLVNQGILIAGVAYLVAAYIDATHITLGATAGTQTGAAYSIFAGAGSVNTVGTAVTSASGDVFTGITAGSGFVIGSTLYAISSVTDATHLVLTASAGTQTGATASYPRAVLAATSAFLDTYGVALPPGSKVFYISAINDFTRWSPLDFGRKSAFPDNIAATLADHEELWLFGSETTEVWRNTGASDFPLQRDPGAFIHQGIRAPFSAVNLANGVAWLGGDARGGPIAWRAQGYQPVRISTHAEEAVWASYSTITDAISFVYVEGGHQFWVLTFPTANATWCYDATAGTWHERGWWNGATDDRQRQMTHGFVFNKHLVGDWQNGKIYEQSVAYASDAGTSRHYIRLAPHLTNEELWTFYSRFRLSMAAGPSPTLSWSADLGVTYNTPRVATPRFIGYPASQFSEWRRLGRGRDRVWRVDILESVYKIALVACYLDVAAGNG